MMKNKSSFRALPRVSRLAILVASLVACATPARNAESRPLVSSAAGYDVQVLVDGSPAPTFWHAGESYVMGSVGNRYVIRVSNRPTGWPEKKSRMEYPSRPPRSIIRSVQDMS